MAKTSLLKYDTTLNNTFLLQKKRKIKALEWVNKENGNERFSVVVCLFVILTFNKTFSII